MQRFKEHGFIIGSNKEFNEKSHALDEVLEKLADLKKQNDALLRRYNGDSKFVRVHKRVREENQRRQPLKKRAVIAEYDEDIVIFLNSIKLEVDQKVYDRNDILRKDTYFEKTVMAEISKGMKKLAFNIQRDDKLFIQDRISREYLEQYNAIYEYI
jgi:type I restriction enzyme R subunit